MLVYPCDTFCVRNGVKDCLFTTLFVEFCRHVVADGVDGSRRWCWLVSHWLLYLLRSQEKERPFLQAEAS